MLKIYACDVVTSEWGGLHPICTERKKSKSVELGLLVQRFYDNQEFIGKNITYYLFLFMGHFYDNNLI